MQDARSIREVFNQIKDDVPSSLRETIQPAAFLEGNGPRFLNAHSRLADWEAQKNSAVKEGQCIQETLSVKKTLLKESPVEINKELATLNEERTQLLARLKTDDEMIRQKEEALSRIPASLVDQKKVMAGLKTKLDKIKHEKKAKIPVTAEEDHQ